MTTSTTSAAVQVAATAPAKINLVKGQNVNLSKENPAAKVYQIGLGWNPAKLAGNQIDLDAVAFVLNNQAQCSSLDHFIYYNNPTSKNPAGAVVHSGDNLTGAGDGDDETILVHLDRLTSANDRIVFAVNIHEAAQRKQNFGQVQGAYIRVINPDTQEVLAKFDLTEDFSVNTGVVFAELYRNTSDPTEWKFKALENGLTGDLASLARSYGLNT